VAHVIDVKAHISPKVEDGTIEEGIGEQSDILAFISERRTGSGVSEEVF